VELGEPRDVGDSNDLRVLDPPAEPNPLGGEKLALVEVEDKSVGRVADRMRSDLQLQLSALLIAALRAAGGVTNRPRFPGSSR
jgi:hypothetical protein